MAAVLGFEVVVPEAITNFIKNPSFEQAAATNWTTSSLASATVGTGTGRWGLYGLTGLANAADDFAEEATDYAPATGSATLSVYVKHAGASLRLKLRNTTDGTYVTASSGTVLHTGSGKWERLWGVFPVVNGKTYRLRVVDDAVAGWVSFQVDGAMLTATDYLTTYVDGNQSACKWLGKPNESRSVAWGLDYRYGKIVNLSDYFTDSALRVVRGVGMPTLQVGRIPYGSIDGQLHQKTVALDRNLTVVGTITGSTVAAVKALRKALLNLFKPDRLPDEQPILLRDSSFGSVLQIAVRYVGGLEMESTWRLEELLIRFVVEGDPFWTSETENAVVLTAAAVSNAGYAARVTQTGQWAALGSGLTGGALFGAVKNPTDGKVYLVGAFTGAGGVADTAGVARYDPLTDTFESVVTAAGVGLTGGTATGYAVEVDADGNAYIGGNFTTVNGVTVNYVAKYTLATGVWTAMNGGAAAATVYALRRIGNGNIAAGGSFSGMRNGTIGVPSAVAHTLGLAVWSVTASSWAAAGASTGVSGGGATVWGIAAHRQQPDGMWVCGDFTTIHALTANRAALWSGTAWSRLGSSTKNGLGGIAYSVDTHPTSYNPVFGGAFTTAMTLTTCKYIAIWNGRAFAPLVQQGGGLNNTVRVVRYMADGKLIAGGAFTTAAGVTLLSRFAVWSGSTWSGATVELPATSTVYTVAVANDPNALYIVGYDQSGNAFGGSVDATVSNAGTAKALPRLVWKNNGTAVAQLYDITNSTLDRVNEQGNRSVTAAIDFNASARLAVGETLTLDLGRGRKTLFSSARGNALNLLKNVGPLAVFCLMPGTNVLSTAKASADTTVVGVIWRERNWSNDSEPT